MPFSHKLVELLTRTNRYLTVLRRRNPQLRLMLPRSIAVKANRLNSYVSGLAPVNSTVRHHCAFTNIYHCCVHKTGSQWIKSLLSDLTTVQYSGLTHYHYQSVMFNGLDPRRITERSFSEPFPPRTIVSPLYIDYANFQSVPKLGPYKAFFVMRDPRDIVVSAFFSQKYSHLPGGNVTRMREILNRLSDKEGLIVVMRFLEDNGLFKALRSWAGVDKSDPNVILVRYEDLRSAEFASLKRLFMDLDIQTPAENLNDLFQAYSFKRVSGRDEGKEDRKSHIRKGVAGDWKNHFSSEVQGTFDEIAGDLVQHLGYA